MGYIFYCQSCIMRIVKTLNARFLNNDEINKNN